MVEIADPHDRSSQDNSHDLVPDNLGGSTLYQRLPDGTWSAHREDGQPLAAHGDLNGSGALVAAPSGNAGAGVGAAGTVGAVVGSLAAESLAGAAQMGGSAGAATVAERISSGQVAALAEAHLAAEVAAVMGGSNAASSGTTGASSGPDAVARPVSPVGNADTPPPASVAAGAPIRVVASPSAPSPAAAPSPLPPAAAAARKGHMPGSSSKQRAKVASPRRTKRWRRPSLKRILAVAALAYAAWVIFLMLYGAFSLNKVPAAAQVPNANTSGTVWLMVGSDSREGLTAQERKELTTGGDFGQRTDTIMLLHMSGLGAPTLVSIPRDSWVTIPEYRTSSGRVVAAHQAKVNAAYAQGGAPLLNQTLQDATGLHIDHYAEVGFGGIVSLTDAVGGIDVCVDRDINDVKSGLKLKAGCHTLDGKEALAYVRMRYSDPRGDLGRIERQQEFVSKVMGEVLSWKTVVFPWRQWAIVNAALDAVAVDEQANLFNVGRLGLGLGQVAAGVGTVTTVPTLDSDHMVAGQWVLRWDDAAAERLWQSMGAP